MSQERVRPVPTTPDGDDFDEVPPPITSAERQSADQIAASIGITFPDQLPTPELGISVAHAARPSEGLDRLDMRDQGPNDPPNIHNTRVSNTGTIPLPETHEQSRSRLAEKSDPPSTRPADRSRGAHNIRGILPLPYAIQGTDAGAQTPQARFPQSAIFTPSATGPENMARRTPIVATPEVPQYTADHSTTPQKAANFRARGQAPIPLTPDQIADAQMLRNVSMEFAILSNNRFVPEGLTVNDLMRLFVARNPNELKSADMIYRTVAAEVLALKKVKKDTDQEIHTLQQKLSDMSSLDHRVSDLEGQMHEWNEDYYAESGNHEEPPRHEKQPSAAGPSRSPAELQKLNYMSKTKIFEGHTASVFSWSFRSSESTDCMPSSQSASLDWAKYHGLAI